MGIAADLVYIVLVALVGGVAARALKQPLILGYIFAGIVVGPHTGGITIQEIHNIEMLAEIGVALLLFTLGLEFSFSELKRIARIAFLGTPVQLLMTGACGYAISRWLEFGWKEALWIGAVVSLSSTMVVLKSLAAKDALNSSAARIMLGILIAQDLAVVPMMLVLPQLTTDQPDFYLIGIAVLKSVIFLAAMFFVGTRVFPRLFAVIARWGSRELFFLTTLAVALGLGFLTFHLGLSFALGAFIAGMLLSETDFNHQALSDVSSLRDLFGLIFFVSVGMLFDPNYFFSEITTVLSMVGVLVLCKAAITGVLVRLFGYAGTTPWIVGLGLAQIGEFAFLVANTGHRTGAFSDEAYSLVIAVTVVSMALTPALMRLPLVLYRVLGREAVNERRWLNESNPPDLSDHVVIIGAGTVGQYVAGVLDTLKEPYLLLESDHKVVQQLRDKGIRVIFGDGSHKVLLEAAGVVRAKLVIVSTTDDMLLSSIVREVKGLNSSVRLVARVEELHDVEHFSRLGVEELVQPQLETSFEMIQQALTALGYKPEAMFALLSQLRSERYKHRHSLDNANPAASEEHTALATKLLNFLWCEIRNDNSLCGATLSDSRLRERFGVSAVAVMRGEHFTPNPGPAFRIETGDKLGILGSQEQLDAFAKELRC